MSKQPAQAGLAATISQTKLLRELLHRVPRLQNPVDVRGLKAAAAGDSAPPGAVDDLGVGPLSGSHREDHRLHVLDLTLGVAAGHLAFQFGPTGNHIEDALERAHLAQLSHLDEKVVEREVT